MNTERVCGGGVKYLNSKPIRIVVAMEQLNFLFKLITRMVFTILLQYHSLYYLHNTNFIIFLNYKIFDIIEAPIMENMA